ncbi:hypothetical protein J3F84DRAFT_379741 [Trichoderma pleuroticola]
METSYASNLDVVLGFVNGVYGIIFFTSIYLSLSLSLSSPLAFLLILLLFSCGVTAWPRPSGGYGKK